MAEAKFSIGQVNITDYLRVIAREVTSPTAEAANILYDPPQPTTRNIIITNLNPVMHYFDFYETPGPSTQGTLLATFTIDVGLINQTALEFIEFMVDGTNAGDPPSQTDTYTNAELDGAEYQVSQRGVGPRSFTDELQQVAGGGFKLLHGEKFNSYDRWFIIVAKTTTTHATVTTRGIYTDVIEVTEDKILDGTDNNTMQEANSGQTILAITFPSLSTIPDDTIFGFSTHYGTQRYMSIKLQSGENMRFKGALKNIIWLGQCETLMIVKKGSLLKVLDDGTAYKQVGQKVKADISPINGLAETGGWKNIADYPRFFYEFVNQLPTGNLSAFNPTSLIVTDRTKFAINMAADQFWMPDTGGYFERNVDPDGNVDTARDNTQRYTGTLQLESVGAHRHFVAIDKATNSNSFPSERGTALTNIRSIIKQWIKGSGGAEGYVLDSDVDEPTIGRTSVGEGTETRPDNVAVNSWRII